MAEVIDGRAVARKLDEQTKAAVDALVATGKPRPGLAVVLVGNDPASEVYVRRKMKGCEKVGINSFEHRLPAETTQDALLTLIARLNADPEVHGILCQVPLPAHIDTRTVLGAITPAKDVDGFHPVNVGLDAVVIGKSNIVGKPVALMLLDRECTVTVTHIYTENLPEIARKADIIVAAAGAPRLVKGDWVKPGAVVIDVGITRIMGEDGKEQLVGDVAFDEVQHAKAVTPVPGGVGPMTIACLLHNTVQAAKALTDGDGKGHDPYHDAPDRSLIYGTAEGGGQEREG